MQRRCGIYVRSATGEREAMAVQAATGIKLCRKKSWRFQVFREIGKPGAEMKKLMKLVRAGKLHSIFVSSWDRLRRDLRQAMVLLDEIRRNGVGIVTAAKCGESIPADVTLLSGLAAAIRGYELSLMAQRRRWALARRRNRR